MARRQGRALLTVRPDGARSTGAAPLGWEARIAVVAAQEEDALPTPAHGTPGVDPGAPTRVFGPMRTAVIAAVVAAVTGVIVLEFLVLTTFAGKRLWADPRMFHDAWFTAPIAIWLAVAAVGVLVLLRVATSWLRIDEGGFSMNGLVRRATSLRWPDVGSIVAVRDVTRRPTGYTDIRDRLALYEGLYVLDARGRCLVSLSGRLFGAAAQHALLEQARAGGVGVEAYDQLTPRDLRRRIRRGLSPTELHPALVIAAVVLFYLAHNVFAFFVWGL